jgi:alpha-galactosidase
MDDACQGQQNMWPRSVAPRQKRYSLYERFAVQHPKVVIIGAGSFFFGRKVIWQMVHSEHLRTGTLALVDTDAGRLDKMSRLARMVIDHHASPLQLEASTDRREVLKDADFVVLCFAYRNAHYRGVDCELSAKYGIRMCSGDTIGPGGVFRTMRELPEILRVCRDIEEICPEAWVINYINPAAVNGIAIRRFFPQLKSFALCDAQWELRANYAKLAGVPDDERFQLISAGPNHFTWTLKVQHDGRDVIPAIVDEMRRRADEDANRQVEGDRTQSKGWMNNAIAVELYEAFGALPTVLGHTKEYVRFYQGRSVSSQDRNAELMLFDAPARIAKTEEAWDRVDEYLDESAPISEFDTEFGPDPATDVIEAMWGNLGRRFFINTSNGGAIPNMADDAFLELYCDLSMEGPRPLSHGPMPLGLRGLCENILDTHELTALAVRNTDRSLLRRALLSDPLTCSIGDTDALIADLLEAEREAIDEAWFVGD